MQDFEDKCVYINKVYKRKHMCVYGESNRMPLLIFI